MRDSWPVVDGLYSLSSLPPVFPSIITRMEQCTWKLLTDEVIPFSVQSRMLGKATLHHVGAHVAARQHVAGYPAARRADGHPRESSCALRRWFQLGNRSIEKFFSKWILIFIYYLLCVCIYMFCLFIYRLHVLQDVGGHGQGLAESPRRNERSLDLYPEFLRGVAERPDLFHVLTHAFHVFIVEIVLTVQHGEHFLIQGVEEIVHRVVQIDLRVQRIIRLREKLCFCFLT